MATSAVQFPKPVVYENFLKFLDAVKEASQLNEVVVHKYLDTHFGHQYRHLFVDASDTVTIDMSEKFIQQLHASQNEIPKLSNSTYDESDRLNVGAVLERRTEYLRNQVHDQGNARIIHREFEEAKARDGAALNAGQDSSYCHSLGKHLVVAIAVSVAICYFFGNTALPINK